MTKMWKIDIFKRKPDGNRGKYITSSFYPDEASANVAYQKYRDISRRGLILAPRDAEIVKMDKQRRINSLNTKIKVWHIDYDKNGYNPETKEDHRYTWVCEEKDNKLNIDEKNIVVPGSVLTKSLSNIIVTKPVLLK